MIVELRNGLKVRIIDVGEDYILGVPESKSLDAPSLALLRWGREGNFVSAFDKRFAITLDTWQYSLSESCKMIANKFTLLRLLESFGELSDGQRHCIELIAAIGVKDLEYFDSTAGCFKHLDVSNWHEPEFDFHKCKYRIKLRVPEVNEPILVNVNAGNNLALPQWELMLFAEMQKNGFVRCRRVVSSDKDDGLQLSSFLYSDWKFID